MNILMVRPRFETGGAPQSILLLSQGLSARGHCLTIATHSGDMVKLVQSYGFKRYSLPLYPTSIFNFIHSVNMMRKIIRQEKIDVLHSHHRFSNLVCKFVSLLSSVPVVSTVHELKYNSVWLTRWGLGQHIITFSEALKNHLVEHYGTPVQRVSVVKMGFHFESPSPQQLTLAKKMLNLPARCSAIGCISRLSEEKGIAILLEAISLVKNKKDRFRCYIVGDGPLRLDLERFATELAINNVVSFVGWQDNVPGIVANLDFLVLPSLSEGLGLVVLEGLAQAKPTIGSRVGGIPEIIEDGKNGLLVAPANVAELAEAIIYLLKNPNLTKQLGQTGLQDLAPNSSIKAMVEETEQIYKTILNCRTVY